MNSTDGEAPESACDLTISDGANDTSGRCVSHVVCRPVSDVCQASNGREPQPPGRDQVTDP